MDGFGIGIGVRRKEDDRFLRGRGQYSADILLAGQSEVVFLRSPIAHGYLRKVTKPQGYEDRVFLWSDLDGVKPMVAGSTLPSYRLSAYHPLAHEKVRFVGEAIAMVIAPTRAEAEDIAERIEFEIDELPALVDAAAAMRDSSVRVHEDWDDNAFLTLNYEKDYAAKSANCDVVIERTFSLSRQAMVPLEGKAMVAHWDERLDQLVIYNSTQVPHIVRSGLSQMMGISEEKIRVVAPDVGGAFGYKCALRRKKFAWPGWRGSFAPRFAMSRIAASI